MNNPGPLKGIGTGDDSDIYIQGVVNVKACRYSPIDNVCDTQAKEITFSYLFVHATIF